jgi:WD40 repeat protein
VIGDVEGYIIFYNVDPFQIIKKIKGHQKGITFIKEGQEKKFITSSEDLRVKVWKY